MCKNTRGTPKKRRGAHERRKKAVKTRNLVLRTFLTGFGYSTLVCHTPFGMTIKEKHKFQIPFFSFVLREIPKISVDPNIF